MLSKATSCCPSGQLDLYLGAGVEFLMHRALLSWELLSLVCCSSYPRLNNLAFPASAALAQAGISSAAHRVGRGWVLTSQEGPGVLMSLINLTNFTWDHSQLLSLRSFIGAQLFVPS